MISKLAENHVLYQKAFLNIHDWWDFLKQFIKLASQNFSKTKLRNLNGNQLCITNLLIEAKCVLSGGDDSVKATIDWLESQLRAINLSKQKSG